MSRKNFRKRATEAEDDAEAGDGVVGTPSSSNKKKPKRGQLLSFAGDEDEQEEQEAPKSRKKGFGTGHGSGHKMGASLAAGTTKQTNRAFSNVLPRAGEYTPEKLQELQKNTIRLKVPPPDAEGIVLKGVLKPVAAGGDGNGDAVLGGDVQAEAVTTSVNVEGMVIMDGATMTVEDDDIPDASRIAAAKAQRERRRLAHTAPDYIPLRTSDGDEPTVKKVKGEAVSSDDEDEVRGRLAFLPKNGSKDAGVFQFNNDGRLPREDEEEDEDVKWEEEQLRKGAATLRGEEAAALRTGLPAPSPSTNRAQLPALETVPIAQKAESVLMALREGLRKQQESYGRTKSELGLTEQRMSSSESNIGVLQKNIENTSKKFVYMQKLRDYVADLCEFLQAKGPLIETLEEEMQKVHENRASAIFERRLADTADEMSEVNAGVGAAMSVLSRGGTVQLAAAQASSAIAAASAVELAPQLDEFGRDVNREIRVRAEARRRRRAKPRTPRSTEAVEHESTSDESDGGEDAYISRRREVLHEGGRIFGDAREEFSELKIVKQRLEEWKQLYSGSYRDAYMSISAPRIFAPYVRLELLNWDPLYSDKGLETMNWYPVLFNYGDSTDDEDADSNLLPTLVEKVALPLLHHQLEQCWDRLSTKSTKNAVAAVKEILVYVPASSEGLRELLKMVTTRLAEAVSALELPVWRIEVTAAVPQAARIASQRFGEALRLLRCIGLWKEVLASSVLEHLAFQELLHAKIVPYLRTLLPTVDDAVTRTERVVAALSSGFNMAQSRHKLGEFMQHIQSLGMDGDHADGAFPSLDILKIF